MLGQRLGSVVGTTNLIGSIVGSVGDDEGGTASGNPMAGVTRDAASGKYFPANAAEWTITMAAAGIASGNPASVWGCQDASGNLSDSIGSNPLVVTNAPGYQQAVSGYTRTAVAFANASTGVAQATIPTTASASALLLTIANVTGAPTATESAMGFNTQFAEVLASGPLRVSASTTATGTTSMVTMGVTPLVLQYMLGTTQTSGFNLSDKVQPTAAARTSTTTFLGDLSLATDPIEFLYAAFFTGTAAELTSTQLKTLLTTLGWTGIGWS